MIKENSPALGTFRAADRDGDEITLQRSVKGGFEVTAYEGARGVSVYIEPEDTAELLRFLTFALSDSEKVNLAHELAGAVLHAHTKTAE